MEKYFCGTELYMLIKLHIAWTEKCNLGICPPCGCGLLKIVTFGITDSIGWHFGLITAFFMLLNSCRLCARVLLCFRSDFGQNVGVNFNARWRIFLHLEILFNEIK